MSEKVKEKSGIRSRIVPLILLVMAGVLLGLAAGLAKKKS